jgi:hypothetical protein
LWELRKQAIFTVCDWALTQGPGDQNGWWAFHYLHHNRHRETLGSSVDKDNLPRC